MLLLSRTVYFLSRPVGHAVNCGRRTRLPLPHRIKGKADCHYPVQREISRLDPMNLVTRMEHTVYSHTTHTYEPPVLYLYNKVRRRRRKTKVSYHPELQHQYTQERNEGEGGSLRLEMNWSKFYLVPCRGKGEETKDSTA